MPERIPDADEAQDEPAGASDGGGSAGGALVDDELTRAAQAAREALGRARAAAVERGLRPGQYGRTRRRRATGESPSTGAGKDGRDPQPFGAGLDRLVSDRGWTVDVAVGGALGRWVEVVGGTLAEHCVPETFEEGVLVVRAESTAWATQVRLLVPTVLRLLAEQLGEGVVQSIQVRGPVAPTWRRGPRSIRGRGPRDTYG